jgi:hypothetical protein
VILDFDSGLQARVGDLNAQSNHAPASEVRLLLPATLSLMLLATDCVETLHDPHEAPIFFR